MVSHTTRLVCYAIPRCPGPSHPDTIIIIIIIIIITAEAVFAPPPRPPWRREPTPP